MSVVMSSWEKDVMDMSAFLVVANSLHRSPCMLSHANLLCPPPQDDA